MAGKMQRCYNCHPRGVEFEADAPDCPRCHAGPPAVVTLTLVHFLLEGGPIQGTHRTYRLACQPARAMLGARWPATAEPGQVTCPLCQNSPGFAAPLAAWRDEGGHVPARFKQKMAGAVVLVPPTPDEARP